MRCAYCALRRRQERERLPRAATAEIEFGRLLDGDRVHASERRPVSALLDELRYCGRRTGNQNLNGAVEAVADPTVGREGVLLRVLFCADAQRVRHLR